MNVMLHGVHEGAFLVTEKPESLHLLSHSLFTWLEAQVWWWGFISLIATDQAEKIRPVVGGYNIQSPHGTSFICWNVGVEYVPKFQALMK